jgi:hypothetical protein
MTLNLQPHQRIAQTSLSHAARPTVLVMSLNRLPTELIESIVAHLDLSATRSIRLVSKSLQQQSLHVFRDRFFRQRSIAWTKEDLEKLRDISTHFVFGAALQHLSIDATPKFSILLWRLRNRISEAGTVHSEPGGVFFKSELQEQYIEIENEAKALTTDLNETQYDKRCMQMVLKNVQALESIEFRYDGMENAYSKFGRRYCEMSQHEMSRPFVSTMTAIAASGLQIKKISINDRQNHGAVGIGRLESLAPALSSFDMAFEKLDTLCLNLRDWRVREEGFELGNDRAPFVVRFLAKARNVKHLDLECYSSLDDDLFGEIARTCAFAKLETCKLAHFDIRKASDLLRLLAPSSFTIQELSLSHIALRDHEVTWPEWLARLATSHDALPALKWMRLAKLFTKTGARLYSSYGPKLNDLIIGDRTSASHWRDELLAHVARSEEGSLGPAWFRGAVAYPFIGMT